MDYIFYKWKDGKLLNEKLETRGKKINFLK